MFNNKKGFTLTELMAVVAIVGILAAIAIFTYTSYSSRARQSDAKTILQTLRADQEQYRAEHGTYTAVKNSLPNWPANDKAGNYYTLDNITNVTANTFTMRARGNIDGDATVDVWRIDQTGNLVNEVDDTKQ